MSLFIKSCSASLILAAASLNTFAAEAPAAAAGNAPDASTVQSVEGQMAVRDADTGRLRAPTAAEAQTLHAAGANVRLAMRPLMTKHHATGATGARLNDEFMSYSVVLKQPDGRLVEYCFDSKDAADTNMAAPASTHDSLPTE